MIVQGRLSVHCFHKKEQDIIDEVRNYVNSLPFDIEEVIIHYKNQYAEITFTNKKGDDEK